MDREDGTDREYGSRRPEFYSERGLNVLTYDARSALETLVVRGDVAFFTEEAGRTGGPVLDLGAGTGRVAWPLAEAGFETVGLEKSPHMLEAARAKAGRYPEDVRERVSFVEGDMSGFELGRSFALAVIPFRSFQCLLTPEEQEASLLCIGRHLVPGGELVVDLFDPRLDWCHPKGMTEGRPVEIRLPDDGRRLRVEMTDRVPDPLTQVISERWIFTELAESGEVLARESEMLRLRWIHRQEARHLFRLCGFGIMAEYSDFRRSEPDYGKEQVWVLRKEPRD